MKDVILSLIGRLLDILQDVFVVILAYYITRHLDSRK